MSCAIIGCGHRATFYIKYILNSSFFRLTELCDISKIRLNAFKCKYKLRDNIIYSENFREVKDVDLYIISVPDKVHYDIASYLIKRNKNILIEKPVAIKNEEIIEYRKLNPNNKIFIPFVLRFTPFFETIKEIINSNKLGKILSINLRIFLNKSHSSAYQRRPHRKKENSGGIFLSKACHDLDIISWLIDQSITEPIKSVSSNQSFSHRLPPFTNNCSTCPLKSNCEYSFDGKYVFNDNDIENVNDLCVYNDDKDIVDTEQILVKFPNGTLANINLVLDCHKSTRLIEIIGSKNMLNGDFNNNISTLNSNPTINYLDQTLDLKSSHKGGDNKFMKYIEKELKTNNKVNNTMFKDAIKISELIINKI